MSAPGAAAALVLVVARARRRPVRWLIPLLGIALSVAFAGSVAVESTIVGDEQARSVLRQLTPVQRTVRVTWQGPVTPAVRRYAGRLLSGLNLGAQTEVTLLNPARLSGVIVRPAAIDPLNRWLAPGHPPLVMRRCAANACPMLLVGGGRTPVRLQAPGVRISVTGRAKLRSAVPLGFAPDLYGHWPVLVSGDARGLDALRGLSGVYRTHSWLARMTPGHLHSWTLAPMQLRLAQAQARLPASAGQLSLSSPSAALATARSEAHQASSRLLLAAGGAAVSLAMFLIIVMAGVRGDQLTELHRLRGAGATVGQAAVFVAGEIGWLVALGAAVGFGAALAVAVVLTAASGEPTAAVLSHSLLTPQAVLAFAVGWLAATAACLVSLVPGSGRLADALAVGASALLVAALTGSRSSTGAWTFLLVPLVCLVAGVFLWRTANGVLRVLERTIRNGPLLGRLTLVNLARRSALPALAIASLAVGLGLTGFALAYRTTMNRASGDQAAEHVPLDATVGESASFTRPLQLAPISRWRTLAHGSVFPVRRTQASFATGDGSTTIPALGIPAGALSLIHGWRTSDAAAPLELLARRLRPRGPVRARGPALGPAARQISVAAFSPDQALRVIADLRLAGGRIRQLPLGTADAHHRDLTARLPPGRSELEALELDEPAGLAATAGHQNAENPAATTQFTAPLNLGPLLIGGRRGQHIARIALGSWSAVGAASTHAMGAASAQVQGTTAAARLRFHMTGTPGILRPPQPFDHRSVPVLVDPATAAAHPGGQIGLTVDGVPINARVVGVLRRFPTLPAGAVGFVVADDAVLASALDGQLPGQGQADELWITAANLGYLRRALAGAPLDRLSSDFRATLERRLRSSPLRRAVIETLLAAAGISVLLAISGLLLVLLGPSRDQVIERDLEEQGVGPRGLRAELIARLGAAGGVGIAPGVVIALILIALAVAIVGGAELASPRPALVTVVPWAQLAVAAVIVAVSILSAGWMATRLLFRDRSPLG